VDTRTPFDDVLPLGQAYRCLRLLGRCPVCGNSRLLPHAKSRKRSRSGGRESFPGSCIDARTNEDLILVRVAARPSHHAERSTAASRVDRDLMSPTRSASPRQVADYLKYHSASLRVWNVGKPGPCGAAQTVLAAGSRRRREPVLRDLDEADTPLILFGGTTPGRSTRYRAFARPPVCAPPLPSTHDPLDRTHSGVGRPLCRDWPWIPRRAIGDAFAY
jgi:hypothetical protein